MSASQPAKTSTIPPVPARGDEDERCEICGAITVEADLAPVMCGEYDEVCETCRCDHEDTCRHCWRLDAESRDDN